MSYPEVIILISGKRKCGKDFIATKLKKMLDDKCTLLRISEPLKRTYAENHNLNLDELLSDSPYKEKYRQDMIEWSDEIRKKDFGYFCRAACENAKSTPIWIFSDIRRKNDIKWFKSTYTDKVKTVRIHAEEDVRRSRGWTFTKGVDDVDSECNLDDYNEWDLKITNNTLEDTDRGIQQILTLIKN